MDCNKVRVSLKVKVTKDEGTTGMLISPKILSRRAVGKTGIVKSFVPGHGGDVWFIEQDNGIAAYCFTEIEEL